MSDHEFLDRRSFLLLTGATTATVAGCGSGDGDATPTGTETAAGTGTATETPTGTSASEGSAYEFGFFDEDQAAVVRTLADRLVPGGDDHPSTTEARVARFVDLALQREPVYRTAHEQSTTFRDAYEEGIDRIQRTADEMFGTSIPDLDDGQVETLLSAVQERTAPGWEDVPAHSPVSMTVPKADFFTILRDHVVEGYYAQPKYGGNVGLRGWKHAGYVGPFVEGYTPDELKPPWKSFEQHEREKTRPADLYGEFGGESS